MAGKSLKEQNFTTERVIKHVAVKESVFPFIKFPGVDTILGPEMKSTGEVMGLDKGFGGAFHKATLASGFRLPREGVVFISVQDEDKPRGVTVAKKLAEIGFSIVATDGTAKAIEEAGVPVERVAKVGDPGDAPTCVDLIAQKKIAMVINTTFGAQSIADSYTIRRTALNLNLPYQTTIEGAEAAVFGIAADLDDEFTVRPLHEYFSDNG